MSLGVPRQVGEPKGKDFFEMTFIDDTLADLPLLLRVSEVAKLIGVSPQSVYRMADAGKLERVEIDLTGTKSIRITNESVLKLIERWMQDAS